MGGKTKNPTYDQVSRGITGHTEVVQVTFDPAKVSYDKLLDVFWLNHDPTVLDRQFCDGGSQYRPEIFYYSDEQKRLAEASKAKWEKAKPFRQPLLTPITQAGEFWPAEDYHQDYYKKNALQYSSTSPAAAATRASTSSGARCAASRQRLGYFFGLLALPMRSAFCISSGFLLGLGLGVLGRLLDLAGVDEFLGALVVILGAGVAAFAFDLVLAFHRHASWKVSPASGAIAVPRTCGSRSRPVTRPLTMEIVVVNGSATVGM